MEKLKWIWQHLIIVVCWVILAFVVAFMQYNSKDFSASILSLTEQDFFEATKRDAWYKKENQIFELFLAEQVRNDWTLTVSIITSPDIQRNILGLTTNYDITVAQQFTWNLIINVNGYENWDFKEWIFQLPYTWETKDLTLEYVKSTSHEFAIGNLDNIEIQTH